MMLADGDPPPPEPTARQPGSGPPELNWRRDQRLHQSVLPRWIDGHMQGRAASPSRTSRVPVGRLARSAVEWRCGQVQRGETARLDDRVGGMPRGTGNS